MAVFFTLCLVARQIHCATMPRITLSGKIIMFEVFSSEILPVEANLKMVEVYFSWIQRHVWGKLGIIFCRCFWLAPPFLCSVLVTCWSHHFFILLLYFAFIATTTTQHGDKDKMDLCPWKVLPLHRGLCPHESWGRKRSWIGANCVYLLWPSTGF